MPDAVDNVGFEEEMRTWEEMAAQDFLRFEDNLLEEETWFDGFKSDGGDTNRKEQVS